MNFPQRHVAALHDMSARLFDSRKTGGDLATLARDLLRGFFDVATSTGLDGVLAELGATERTTLEDDAAITAALIAQLETIHLDGGGPRNQKPRQLADCALAALALTVVEEPDRSISLGGDVRAKVAAAIAGVVELGLAVPAIREAIIVEARMRCNDAAFTKVVTQLDERGAQLIKQPKVPIEAMQHIQRALTEAREAVIARITNAAFDRAQEVLGGDAAARIDQAVTLRATPRELAAQRAMRAGLTPAMVTHALLEALTDLVWIAWQAPEQTVVPYAASKTFRIGDVIEHPKFGRGAVVGALMQRIDVEFPDGKHTLIHIPPRR
ncbi:MAG: hypothetical protein ABI467_31510 [Kofleriaceae bacterium]